MMTAEQIAEKLRNSASWSFVDCKELCKQAGISLVWGSCYDDLKPVYKAAEILNVKIDK